MKKHLAVAALFLFLTCMVTFPLCFHLTHAVSTGDRSGDHLAFLWNLWWAKKSLVDLGTNPYFTDYIFYPQGKSLLFHTLTLPYGIVSIPLQLFPGGQVGLILSYNLIVIATFVLSGYLTYFFVWKQTGDVAAGIVSGSIFAFSPFRIWHLNCLDLLSTFWLPLAAYLVIRMLESGKAKYAVLSAIVFALTVYTSYLMALFVLFFLLVAVVCRGMVIKTLKVVGIFFVIALILILPLLLPVLQEAGDALRPDEEILKGSSNLLAYVVPYSPLTVPGRLGLGSSFGHNGMTGRETFLGYVPLSLGLLALLGPQRRKMWFWVILGVASAIISLGPYLHIWRWIITMPLPYYFISKIIPLAKIFRAPGRFSLVVTFSVSVMAGYGFIYLRSLLRSKGKLLCSIIVALIILEFCPFPNLLDLLLYPGVFDSIAAEEEDFAILEIPLHDYYDNCYYMYCQTIHEKKLLGGMASRLSRKDFSLLRSLPPLITPSNRKIDEGLSEKLGKLGVKYIIYHGPDPEPVVVRIY